MDTPEINFGTQPYGPEASAFAKRELEAEEVGLERDDLIPSRAGNGDSDALHTHGLASLRD